jgi:hypothetical protein
MTFSQALQTIHKHWKVLPHESNASHEAVWIRIPPEDAAEVEEEWVGMRGDGSLVWAYLASRPGAFPSLGTIKPGHTLLLQWYGVKPYG